MQGHRARHGAPELNRAVTDPDWAFHADDELILAALASGRRRASLSAYFGTDGYRELAALARSPRRAARTGEPVLVLPGIMGTKLGTASKRGGHKGMVWFEPAAIGAGRLPDLALPAGRALEPRGVQLLAYARLVLQMRQQGFDVALHPYDWRLSLQELGAQLAARITAGGKPIVLVAHSMGGLVARVALRLVPKRSVHKLILVGTPNFGSFAAVQALRGTYGFVRKLARLDAAHSPESLASHVFHTFPGLYQLLPAGGARGIANLCRPGRWPSKGLLPDPTLLAQVERIRARLAAPDERMVQIVGVNCATVTGLLRSDEGFEYRVGWSGDGTVPLAHALLPGLATYYATEMHARLPCNSAVIRATIDLVQDGRTRALPQRWRSRREVLPVINDAALRKVGRGKVDWQSLDARSRMAVLADLNS